ncbi:MAG: c-type cytochrome [Kiloniellaceae bacterium]
MNRHAGIAWIAFCLAATVLSSTPARAETLLERGTYLLRGIVACGNCHTPQGPDGPLPGMELAGGLKIEDEAFTAYGANLTPDVETGLGGWSDEEIITAIREGRRPDGTIIGPPMPIGPYRNMSDRDVQAIVAYLRSLTPVKNAVPKSVYRMPLPPGYGPAVGTVPEVSKDDKLAYGAYLAGPLGHCVECHSPMGPMGPDWRNQLGAGGLPFHGPWGISYGSNITPTSLGSWSDSEIKAAITEGVRPDGSRLLPPMPVGYYQNIAADDLDALVAYLRSLPAK